MTTDFIHGRPMKQIVLFSLPIMLSSLLQYTYNMVDNIIVGRYVSTNALAAVGNIAPISSFCYRRCIRTYRRLYHTGSPVLWCRGSRGNQSPGR